MATCTTLPHSLIPTYQLAPIFIVAPLAKPRPCMAKSVDFVNEVNKKESVALCSVPLCWSGSVGLAAAKLPFSSSSMYGVENMYRIEILVCLHRK